ncbi:MAG TPA: phosphatidylglycerol lysyltransferase domain-containing protein, partial [Ktedonobacterales bacterium]|nr:phosphatidylglycerol lysyltransferase domain-containing protein [Ktedonobacterales bacterium]
MQSDAAVHVAPLALVRPQIASRVVRIFVALLVGLTGVADMCSALRPIRWLSLMLNGWPLAVEVNARSFAVVIGFFLIMLARGLARSKRHAWQITILLLLLSTFWHLWHGRVVIALALTLLLIGMLGVFAPAFRARSDRPSIWRGYASLGAGFLIVYLYALGGTLLLEHRFAPIGSLDHLSDGIMQIIEGAPILRHQVPHAMRLWIFSHSLAMLTCVALVYGVASLLRPAISSLHHSRVRRAEVTGLIRRWGANATAAFALAPDKRYFLAAGERGAVAYVVAERIAVVLGDPIAAPEDIAPVLAEFVQWCHLNDLQVAFWQARSSCLPFYQAAGLRAMKIGEEAVVDLANFTLKGGAMQNVRTTMRHAEKAGVTVRFYAGVVGDPLLAAEVDGISRAWLAAKGNGEMGFSMGRWGDTYLPDRLVAVAVDAQGHAQAFTTFVPVYGRSGWALDLMRRSPQATSGTMELLLVRAIERFHDEGANLLSLGLAPLANSTGEPMT